MFEQGISFISNNLFSILTIANTLFLAFGVKWYEKRLQKSLSKELESYKSNLNKDIEKYKTELNLLHDRKLSFSKNEIDTLKELWSYFIESFYKFKNSCGICNVYPDITNMNEQDLNDYFKEADYISERDKIIILKSYNKQKTLENILDKKALSKAHKNINECLMYLDKNSIFVSPDIKEKIDIITKEMRLVLVRYDMHITNNVQQFAGKDIYELLYSSVQKIDTLKTEIELEIQQILFSKNTFWQTDKK